MKTKWITGLVAAAVMGITSVARAADADIPIYRGDAQFFKEFWDLSVEVVQIGQLSQTQTQDPQVQSLGQQLVRDYQQANQLEVNLAETVGEAPVWQTSDDVNKEVSKLGSMTGIAFDRAALDALLKREETVNAQLGLEIANSPNLAVRQLAAILQGAVQTDISFTQQVAANVNAQTQS
jgi:hypothetical protein